MILKHLIVCSAALTLMGCATHKSPDANGVTKQLSNKRAQTTYDPLSNDAIFDDLMLDENFDRPVSLPDIFSIPNLSYIRAYELPDGEPIISNDGILNGSRVPREGALLSEEHAVILRKGLSTRIDRGTPLLRLSPDRAFIFFDKNGQALAGISVCGWPSIWIWGELEFKYSNPALVEKIFMDLKLNPRSVPCVQGG